MDNYTTITQVLGKPSEDQYTRGRYSLVKYWLSEAASSAPVTPKVLTSTVQVSVSEPAYDNTAKVFQFGCGDRPREIKDGMRVDGTITVLEGGLGDVLAAFLNQTWTTAGTAAIPLAQSNDNPDIHLELVCRSPSGTHLFSLCIVDMIIDDIGFTQGLDHDDQVIKFHTYREPFKLCADAELVYDVWTSTPGTLTYALSCGTPLDLVTAANHNNWDYSDFVFIKVKENGEDTGTEKRSEWSETGGSITTTGTGSPSASARIQALYAKAS